RLRHGGISRSAAARDAGRGGQAELRAGGATARSDRQVEKRPARRDAAGEEDTAATALSLRADPLAAVSASCIGREQQQSRSGQYFTRQVSEELLSLDRQQIVRRQ